MSAVDLEAIQERADIARTDVLSMAGRVRELEAVLRDLRGAHEPDDGEWLCPEDAEEVCDVCLNGGAHEGKVCYTCSDPDSNMAIWPCHVARSIDAVFSTTTADRTATPEGRAEIRSEWIELEAGR